MAIAPSLLLCCVGCGTSGADDAPQKATHSPAAPSDQAVARAAVTAARNTSARINETIRMSDATHDFEIDVTGGFDMAKDTGTIAVDFPPGAISHMDEVFAGGNVYLRGTENLKDGWGKIPRDKAEVHYILRAPLNDPEFVLQQIAAMTDVTKESPETINGVPATHYHGGVGFSALALRMAPATSRQLAALGDASGGDLRADADVWTDPQGRLVRTRTSVHSGSSDVTVVMTLADIGSPVKASVPPADSVTAITAASGVLPG